MGNEVRKGELIEDGETTTLMFRRVLDHPPELVWEAISTPEGLTQWLLCAEVTIDRERGTIEMVSGAAHYPSKGKILTWQPSRVLEYEWQVAPVPEMPLGERAIFRYELAAQGASTLLTVIYRRITLATARGFLPGLHAFLDRLEAQLDGATLPDWFTRFSEVRGEYPVWEAHATPPAK